MDPWPEHAFQVSQELYDLFEAFNHPQAVPNSYAESIIGNGSDSGQSHTGHNQATFSPLEDSEDVLSLFTDLF